MWPEERTYRIFAEKVRAQYFGIDPFPVNCLIIS